MSFPGVTQNVRVKIVEAGGQPLPFSSVPDGTILQRSGILLVGSNTLPADSRFSEFLLQNQSDGLYYTIRLRNNAMGVAELYISDSGVP